MASNAQHNFAAIQLQLQTLQLENSALTKDVCLKENYIQLKDQQFRVMQKRLEDLESAVATWKDKYLEQLNRATATPVCPGAAAAASVNPNEDDSVVQPARAQASPPAAAAPMTTVPTAAAGVSSPTSDDRVWVPWKTKVASVSAASKSKSVQQALGLIERLSLDDREKLKPMVAAITNSDGFAEALAATQWEEVFTDVSEELSKILLLYLLPVLLENQRAQSPGSAIQCYSRTYTKQTMDFRIVCLPGATTGTGAAPLLATSPNANATALDAAVEAQGAAQPPLAATDARPLPVVRSLSSSANAVPLPAASSPSSEFSSAIESAADASEPEPPHLFDCVECDLPSGNRRSGGAAAVPHGPRELHPTKAVYISKPLPSATGASGTSTSASTSALASRRYSLTPSRASTMLSSETSRTTTMTALSSPFTSGSGLSLTDLSSGDASDRRSSGGSTASGASSAPKDGKIKKVLGSVMDRLNRHKPQLTTARPSFGDDESICDGCGRGPIVNTKWVCRTCRLMDDREYELCEKCYGQGLHGKEHEDALFTRIEDIVVAKCPRLANERALMTLLRVGICKANLKKFSFCLTWIADLLQCKQTKELRARALEISQIAPHVRSDFVRLLTDLLQRYRRDIEVVTEWQPVQASSAAAAALAAAAVVGDDTTGGVATLQLDTLRIWVKDSVESANA